MNHEQIEMEWTDSVREALTPIWLTLHKSEFDVQTNVMSKFGCLFYLRICEGSIMFHSHLSIFQIDLPDEVMMAGKFSLLPHPKYAKPFYQLFRGDHFIADIRPFQDGAMIEGTFFTIHLHANYLEDRPLKRGSKE